MGLHAVSGYNSSQPEDDRTILAAYFVALLERVLLSGDDNIYPKVIHAFLRAPHFLLGLLILVSNLSMCALILSSRKLRRRPINLLICASSVSDSIYGVRAAVLDAFLCPCTDRAQHVGISLANTHEALHILSITISTSLLVAIVFMRYRGIVYTLHQPRYTYTQVVEVMVGILVTSLALTTVHLVILDMNIAEHSVYNMWRIWCGFTIYNIVLITIMFAVPLTAMTVMVLRMRQVLANNLVARDPANGPVGVGPSGHKGKALQMVLYLYISYAVLYIPFWALQTWFSITRTFYYDGPAEYILIFVFNMLMFSNGFINNIIYIRFCTDIKHGAQQIYKRFCCRVSAC